MRFPENNCTPQNVRQQSDSSIQRPRSITMHKNLSVYVIDMGVIPLHIFNKTDFIFNVNIKNIVS